MYMKKNDINFPSQAFFQNTFSLKYAPCKQWKLNLLLL